MIPMPSFTSLAEVLIMWRNVPFTDKERGPRETPCPRCGGDAQFRFLDEGHARVEVSCPDCGRFEMARVKFDQAVADIVEPEDRH